MNRAGQTALVSFLVVAILVLLGCQRPAEDPVLAEVELACTGLIDTGNLTVTSARLVDATELTPQYCYIKGIISPAIQYHVQLPLPEDWNGRFLNWGDGGKDGDLDFADHRLAQGYAVANSNMGHDNGSEPGASFAFNNRQAEIDFAYRAVHLTVQAAKTLIKVYYGRDPEYSYHEGCSTGGREGLMEAQRYPYDFDGIVAGDPVNSYQLNNVAHVWNLQRLYLNNFAGMLAFDTDGDGKFDDLTKVNMIRDAVLAKCDELDGIKDGVIDYPPRCTFDPDRDLASKMCPNDVNAAGCFTEAQLQAVKDFYRGPHDGRGRALYPGKSYGWEFEWAQRYIPHPANDFEPYYVGPIGGDHLNFLFYETDPGVPPPVLSDPTYQLDKEANPPEYAWWEFSVDDVSAGKGDFMMAITDSTNPDLKRFLVKNEGKLILYHGWCDYGPPPQNTVAYYQQMVETTFGGDMRAAQASARLFMVPGMSHCGGGPGPNEWDKLAPLVDWVENGRTPESIIATHSTDGVVDNERPLCPYPQIAVYKGPEGQQNDPVNWVRANFSCQELDGG